MTVNAPTQAAVPAQATETTHSQEAPKGKEAGDEQAPAKTSKDEFFEKLEGLTKKERALYRERQAFQQEREKFGKEMQRLSEMEARLKAFEEKKGNAKKNPLDYLSEAELSYDDLTNFMLSGGKPSPQDELQSVRDEIRRLREEREQEKKTQAEEKTSAQKAEVERVISTFKEEIGQFIEQNKTTYELSAQRDATEDIFTTINDAFILTMNEWKRSGEEGDPPQPMSIKQAADLVEEFYEKEVMRLTETAKWKARSQAPKGDEEQPGQKAKEPSKTLNNSMTSSVASVLPAKNEADRMKRALAKLSGE